MITVNGRTFDGCEGKPVSYLTELLGYKTEYIAVELNGGIVKRARLGETILADGDKVEIVCFVGGG